MELTLKQPALLKALGRVKDTAAAENHFPILTHVKLTAQDDGAHDGHGRGSE